MKPFTMAAALLLGIIGLLQAVRFALAWPVTINGFDVPVWVSAVAALVLVWIALMLARESKR